MEKKGQRVPTKDEHRMNMVALQRIDPFIIEILQSSSQVALYKYISCEWEKTEIEGTLFVYKRKCEPLYGFLILNRLSANNWIQPVAPEFDTQIQKPFLLYKLKSGDIYGVWFYEPGACEQIGECLKDLVQITSKAKEVAGKSSSSGMGRGNLVEMLQKAENNQTETRKPNNAINTKLSPSGGEKLMRLLSKEPQPQTGPPSSGSVAAFFAHASQQENNSLSQIGLVNIQQPLMPAFVPPGHPAPSGTIFPFSSKTVPPVNETAQDMLQTILKPQAVSMESLERAHRGKSQTPNEMPPMPLQATKADDLEADLKNKLNLRANERQRDSGGKGNKHPTSKKAAEKSISHNKKSEAKEAPISYASALKSGFEKSAIVTTPDQLGSTSQTLSTVFDTQESEIQLMTPLVFASVEQPLQMPVSAQNINGHVNIEPLTRGQFIQAFLHLFHNDESFVNNLHQAYVASFNNKLS